MTRQIRDKLLFEDRVYSLNIEIVEKYFNKYPAKRPNVKIMCSALWRGYVASFEIFNNELNITDIKWLMDMEFKTESKLNEIFVNTKVDWFSGLIRIDDYRDEFDLEPENGIFEYLQISKGNFIKKWTLNFDELQKFKLKQYEYFIASEDVEAIYELYRKKNVNGSLNKDRVNDAIKKHIMRYTTEVYV